MRIVATGLKPELPILAPNPSDHRLDMPERTLHEAIEELADHLGWHSYHTYDARRSKAGFPDLVLWRNRFLFAELKSTKGRITEAQKTTLQSMANAHGNIHLWRPVDWIVGAIDHELRRP